MKKLMVILIVLVAVSISITGCSKKDSTPQAPKAISLSSTHWQGNLDFDTDQHVDLFKFSFLNDKVLVVQTDQPEQMRGTWTLSENPNQFTLTFDDGQQVWEGNAVVDPVKKTMTGKIAGRLYLNREPAGFTIGTFTLKMLP